MDLRLTEEQEMIQAVARDFLRNECPKSLVRAMEDDPRGYSPELWSAMAELGWMGLAVPEAYGGTGGSFLDLCVLIEEQGRFLLPGPFIPTVVLCGLPIARFGAAAQRAAHLPEIAAGRRLMAYAQTEPSGRWGPTGIELTAAARGDGYVLDGTKLFVGHAHVADYLLVAARTGGTGTEGITLVLIDAKTPGIACERLETIGADHQSEVRFEGVRVPEDNVLGRAGEGWEVVGAVNQWGAAAKCAEMVGAAERVLEMSVAYAKERTQFGRPIGSFQAIQHHCANMATDVDGSRFIAYEAIWRLSEGLDAALEVAVAKAWVSDACRRVCALGHQIHGAIGYTREHDMQLYSRRLRAAELAFGDADHHREAVARQLGL